MTLPPRGLALVALLVATAAPAQPPLPPDQQAEVPLAAGRKALDDGNLPAAADQFQRVLDKFPKTPQATAARYGLGLVKLAGPSPDPAKAAELLAPAADDGGFADRGSALYQLAVCLRALGLQDLDAAAGTPDERKKRADARFAEAAKRFADAREWFAWKKRDDWAGRARCDGAEMLLRLGKTAEARATCEPFAKDPAYAKNPSRPHGLYLFGLAAFLERDTQTAGRTLNQLAPFDQPGYGPHARYLVGRVLHLSGEGAEASVNYDGVVADYEKARKDAAETLKHPERFKGQPFEKARLERVATGPPPEYVAAAGFHGAGLNYEAGKFAEALGKFQAFGKDFPASPLRPDADLRAALCQVQLKQADEAVKLLEPLAEKTPRLADQALMWLAKARLAQAAGLDPADAAGREAKAKAAIELLRKAADKAAALAATDPDSKSRRHDILFELGDALQVARQFREAAAVYDQLANEGALANRREELLQRRAAAWGSAGEYSKSDGLCDDFRRLYPQGVLLPAVLYRAAENAYARAVAAGKGKPQSDEGRRLFDEAAGRYREVADKFPEFDRVSQARYAAGVCLARLGNLDEAVKVLEAIPGPDRVGDLAPAGFLLADCLLRQAPTKAEDALAENQIREKLTAAAPLFEAYAAADPKGADAPAALLKLGLCQKRLGSTLADPAERNQLLAKARETFGKLQKDYPADPLAAHGRLEQAKVKALQGDAGGAMSDLRKFAQDPALGKSPVAPLAALHLATLLREQGKPAEAEKVLAEARPRYEPALSQDPERADWAHLMKYQQALAILEQNKPALARPLFEEVSRAAAGQPVAADAALRAGQCVARDAARRIEEGQKLRQQAGNDAGKRAAADRQVTEGRWALNSAAMELANRANNLREKFPAAESRARMLYDAAWASRQLAEDEVTKAREAAREEARKKLVADIQAKHPAGAPAPYVPPPEVPRERVPAQPAEKQAAEQYRKLIEEFGDTALAVDARVELGEMLAEQGDHAGAVKLFKEAIDKEPADRPAAPETLDRARLRLGASLFTLKDFKAAQGQFDAVAGNPKSPYVVQAAYRAGDARLAAGDPAGAADKLKPFRDKREFQGQWQVSDLALLRLGQAYLAGKKWGEARQAFEAVFQQFGGGTPYKLEARYGLAAALEGEGRLDDAVREFEKVAAASTGAAGARAQARIGRCKLQQKKYAEAATALMAVPYGHDGHPEVGYAALLDAAEAYAADNKPAEAEAALRKVLADAPKEGEWAKAAAERLTKGKK